MINENIFSLSVGGLLRIDVYDTTLRDGSQSEGISYSLEDKIKIAKQLDSIEYKLHKEYQEKEDEI